MTGAVMNWPWLEHLRGGVSVVRMRVADSPAGHPDADPTEHEYVGYRDGRHVAFTDTEHEMRWELDDDYRAAFIIANRAHTIENGTTPDGLEFQVIRATGDRAAVIVGDFAAARRIEPGDDLIAVAESLRWAVA